MRSINCVCGDLTVRQECEQFHGRLRALCEGTAEGVTARTCDLWRITKGLAPLSGVSAATTVVATNRREASQQIAYTCQHRGEKIRDDESNLCGSRGEQISIFRCNLHDTECSMARYCQHQTVRQCNRCEDRQPTEMPPPFPQQRGPNPFTYTPGQIPEFVTMERLQQDVRTLSSMIPPETSMIVGVSRSGVTIASMIAMLLHLPFSIIRQSMGDVIEAGNGWRLTGNTGGQGPAVVVDDTCMTGNSFKQVMPIVWRSLPGAISAAVYVNPLARLKPDLFVRELPHPHLLEWNLFNSVFGPGMACDFDGILCADCDPRDDDDGDRYRGFLLTATPKYMVRKTRLPLIVTARLEKWRKETEQWLACHGIACDQIIMGPWASNRERAKVDIGQWKGGHFSEFMRRRHRIKPPLFVESDERQARRIAEVSGGVVVCPAAGRCF